MGRLVYGSLCKYPHHPPCLSRPPAGDKFGDYVLETADNFTYTDPIDGSVAKNQVRLPAPAKYGLSLSPHEAVLRPCLDAHLLLAWLVCG